VRALGLTTAKRSGTLPDIAPIADIGVPGYEATQWYGFLAPAGTPAEVVAKLNTTVNAILADREFVEKNMTSQGMAPMAMSPQQMGALIRQETQRMTDIVRKSGAKVE